MKRYPGMQDVSTWVKSRHTDSNFTSCVENTDHFSWVPVKPILSPSMLGVCTSTCSYVVVRDSAQVVLVENTLTSEGILPRIHVIDWRYHETSLWCFECEDVFWAPTSADGKTVRSLYQNHCLDQNNTDFIWLDDVCLRDGSVNSHCTSSGKQLEC